ncbi:MAG: class II fructose-bisphosphate aldolase [Candidatus Sumerlaeota bacterium]|nr:class II fructose-bisphosphate aldolase [Candidatus Sumerlaeota bacterium]
MLTILKKILDSARAGHYAVPAFDCVEDVMIRSILDTCQAKRCPAILMGLLGGGLEEKGWAFIPGLVRAVADQYDIPVALHLDHAVELDAIKRAVDGGFTSVMIDGSRFPFEKNAEITKAAVDIAHPHGISVEAELGYVGGMNLEATAGFESVLTEPGEVARFIEWTDVDALAVSIGTAHGVYQSLPNLNIERLKVLNAASRVPLVLHGGSGTPDDQIREAVRHGICKLNIFADLRIAMANGLKMSAASLKREDPLPSELFAPIRQEMAKVIAAKIDLLNAAGQA